MPGRKFSSANGYRYGFNGKENDKDAGEGIQDYGMRIYDGRLGRFLSVDPLTFSYPWYTPYQFAGNMPIKFIDLDGGEPKDPGKEVGEVQEGTNGSGDQTSKSWKWDGKKWNENLLDPVVITSGHKAKGKNNIKEFALKLITDRYMPKAIAKVAQLYYPQPSWVLFLGWSSLQSSLPPLGL